MFVTYSIIYCVTVSIGCIHLLCQYLYHTSIMKIESILNFMVDNYFPRRHIRAVTSHCSLYITDNDSSTKIFSTVWSAQIIFKLCVEVITL